MIENIGISQSSYLAAKPLESRKVLGQFFTSDAISAYMASLITPIENTKLIRILDAGAGMGILTIAATLKCLELGHKNIHAVLYELDSQVKNQLHKNLDDLASVVLDRGGQFTYEIRIKDFVLDRPDKHEAIFHLSLINPPYFKYNSESVYCNKTSDLYKGNPNIYTA
jgi:adenine-specific DNA-methyltransferase